MVNKQISGQNNWSEIIVHCYTSNLTVFSYIAIYRWAKLIFSALYDNLNGYQATFLGKFPCYECKILGISYAVNVNAVFSWFICYILPKERNLQHLVDGDIWSYWIIGRACFYKCIRKDLSVLVFKSSNHKPLRRQWHRFWNMATEQYLTFERSGCIQNS